MSCVPFSVPEVAFKKWLGGVRFATPSIDTYVPALEVRSGTTLVNFVGEIVVLSTRDRDDMVWSQYSFRADDAAAAIRDQLKTMASRLDGQ